MFAVWSGEKFEAVAVRFLMVAMQYPVDDGRSYLTTELGDALVAAGHSVEVLHLDWRDDRTAQVEELKSRSGIRIVHCSSRDLRGVGRTLRHASKFVLSGRRAARVARSHFDLASFDCAIAWMPASAIAPLVSVLERAAIPKRLLFVWDFFPDHYHEIGRIPGGPSLWIARALERNLLKRFTAIVCTLPANADYLRRNFRVMPDQQVLTTPIWGQTSPIAPVNRAPVRRLHDLPPELPIAVFGGQLVEGRGFDQMLAAAEAALIAGSNLQFLFVGDGRLAPLIRDRAASKPNLHYRPSISREDYLQLLGACDVGMVATVPGVTSFSIPSKTIDYLRAGLPIVAAVERSNEYVDILTRYGVGVGVPFGDPERFFMEAGRLSANGPVRQAAARCLKDVFDVRHAVAAVTGDAADVAYERAA